MFIYIYIFLYEKFFPSIITNYNKYIINKYVFILYIQGVSKVPGRLDNLKNTHHREK